MIIFKVIIIIVSHKQTHSKYNSTVLFSSCFSNIVVATTQPFRCVTAERRVSSWILHAWSVLLVGVCGLLRLLTLLHWLELQRLCVHAHCLHVLAGGLGEFVSRARGHDNPGRALVFVYLDTILG